MQASIASQQGSRYPSSTYQSVPFDGQQKPHGNSSHQMYENSEITEGRARGGLGRMEERREERLRKKKQQEEEEDRNKSKSVAGTMTVNASKNPTDVGRRGQTERHIVANVSSKGTGSRMRLEESIEKAVTENKLKRPTNFIWRAKFTNELPPPAFAPKWLTMNQDKERYTQYTITSLEKKYKFKLHVDPDMGIPLDLLDMTSYSTSQLSETPELAPEDLELLRDDILVVSKKSEALRVKERPTGEGLNWLVHTQYIAPSEKLEGSKRAQNDKETKFLALKQATESDLPEDRESVIEAIEESFRLADEVPVHPTNPSLVPLEVLPVLPNINRLGDQYVQLVFDTDPLNDSKKHRNYDEEVKEVLESRALMKNFKMAATESHPEQSFVAYMVPSTEQPGPEQEVDETLAFDWVREYHWTVGKAETGKSSFLLCFEEDAVRILPLNTKLTVKKLKATEGKSNREFEEREEFPIPKEVTVTKRDFNELEEELRENMRNRLLECDSTEFVVPNTKRQKVDSEPEDDENSVEDKSEEEESGSDKSGSDADSGERGQKVGTEFRNEESVSEEEVDNDY